MILLPFTFITNIKQYTIYANVMNTNNNDNKSNNNLSITSYPLELQITLFIVFITSIGLTLFLVSLGGEEKEQQTLLSITVMWIRKEVF